MSIRIYALAKQLQLDSKTLVELCKTAGIEGKGSALAALTEEEAEKVKATLGDSSAKQTKNVADDGPKVPVRPATAQPHAGKIRLLPPSSPKPRAADVTPEPQHDTHETADTTGGVDTVAVAQEVKVGVDKDDHSIVATIPPHSVPIPTPTPPVTERRSPLAGLIKKTGHGTKTVSTTETSAGSESPSEPSVSSTSEATATATVTHDVPATVAKPLKSSKSPKSADTSDLPDSDTPSDLEGTSEPSESSDLSDPSVDTQTDESKSSATPLSTGLSHAGHAALVRGENYRGPMRTFTDKIPVLGDRKKSGTDANDKTRADKTGKAGGPSIRLAPLPKSAPVKPAKPVQEPKPQKPDMKLSPEALRGALGTGGKVTADQLRQLEEKQRQTDAQKKLGGKKSDRPSDHPTNRSSDKTSGKTSDKSTDKSADKDNKRGKTSGVSTTTATAQQLSEQTKRKGARKRGRGGPGGGDDFESTPVPQKGRSDGSMRGGTSTFISKKSRGGVDMDEMVYIPRQLKRQKKNARTISTAPRKSDMVIQLPCTVKQFAEVTGISVAILIKKLIEIGTPAMINSTLERETVELLSVSLQLGLDIRNAKSLEDQLVTALFETPDPEDSLVFRPPVVTFLGHVDHGKTSLLDRIIGLNVAAGERGGITQHIRAYRVTTAHGDVTFVDTPGHEAFTEMRARGANCTDIAVLVVAADDGVMPQTEEAISHAKAAGVPIVVALNKMDLPGANYDKALQELAANELLPSVWGGDTEIVPCSAVTGDGIDSLLQTLLMVAELHELKANPHRAATGMILEAELQSGQGVVCKALVQNGTLQPGDIVLCDSAFGRVKAMYDTLDVRKPIAKAMPGTPVNLIGLDVVPSAGSKFCVLDDLSAARQIADKRSIAQRSSELSDVQSHVTLESLFQRVRAANTVQTLNVILRADVRGSIDAIKKELSKLVHPEVKIRILQAVVGGITEADVQLADASDAIIVGFNVVPDENARQLAERKKIQIRRYDIIYNLTADIKAALEGMLKPLEQVKELGRALVQRVYTISRLGTVAGCRVLAGTIERDSRIRIIRDSRVIGEYGLDSLKREKDDAKEVRDGYECGMKLKGFNDLKEGDLLESYRIEEIARTF